MLMTFSNCSFSFIERNYKSIIEPVTESDPCFGLRIGISNVNMSLKTAIINAKAFQLQHSVRALNHTSKTAFGEDS